MSSTSKPAATSTSSTSSSDTTKKPRNTGKPSQTTHTIESTERNPSGRQMQGMDAVAVVIENDGFGHYRATNLGDDAPIFDSEDEALAWVTSEHIPGGSVVKDEKK